MKRFDRRLARRTTAGRLRIPTLHRFLVAAAMIVACALSLPARADDDLPGRVGRIAEFAGQLFLAPQDRASEWAPVGVNYPVTSGDNLWVSEDGRAEIDYGGGQFRLAGDTNVHVSRLDERQLALFIAQGRLILRVRVLEAGDAARVDTPNTQVTLTRPGLYRIDIAPDRQATTVSVREGEALVGLTSGALQALPGQMMTVTGPEPAYADIRNGFGLDGFDSWSEGRDRRYEQGRTTAYVSPQMVGYAELDEYGVWETTATYGPVWYPTAVAADWAPYRYGYWTSVGSWGLTWVDAAPWGYAPSHYGRWVRVGPRWGWCPGAHVARPYWAPALVAWYGGGSWAGSAGAPIYGWVPLGWGDPYHPGWRGCSHNCWTRYNRPYAVDVAVRPSAPPARYSLASVPGAMTAVAAPTLNSRKPVSKNMVPLPLSLATSAPVLAAAPPVAPTPSHSPAFRPGERGTPAPASTVYSRTWAGRGGAAAQPAPSGSPGASAPVGTPGARSGGGLSGAPSTFAPTPRPAPATLPPVGQGSAQRDGMPYATPPAANAGQPVVPTPPVAGRPVAPAAAPPAGSLGSGGLPLPPPRPVQAPIVPSHVAPAPSLGQPPVAPSRVAPTPSLGQPVPAPAAAPAPAAPARQPPAPAKPADADKGSPGTGPVPK